MKYFVTKHLIGQNQVLNLGVRLVEKLLYGKAYSDEIIHSLGSANFKGGIFTWLSTGKI
jgi:hypothetical protein